MSRKPLNIWRVYMDLLANFMGLIIVGGVGLSIMIGGVIIHAAIGSASSQSPGPVCDPAVRSAFGNLPLRSNDSGRISTAWQGKCEIKLSYPKIIFAAGESKITPQMAANGDGLGKICRDLIDSVEKAKTVRSGFVVVDVVGHASEEFASTSTCGTQLNSVLKSIKDDLQKNEDKPGYKAAEESLGLDPGKLDQPLCNATVALERATEVVRKCADYSTARNDNMRFSSDVMRYVTLISEPQNSLTSEGDTCAKPIWGEKLANCQRTVTLKIRFLPPPEKDSSNSAVAAQKK